MMLSLRQILLRDIVTLSHFAVKHQHIVSSSLDASVMFCPPLFPRYVSLHLLTIATNIPSKNRPQLHKPISFEFFGEVHKICEAGSRMSSPDCDCDMGAAQVPPQC